MTPVALTHEIERLVKEINKIPDAQLRDKFYCHLIRRAFLGMPRNKAIDAVADMLRSAAHRYVSDQRGIAARPDGIFGPPRSQRESYTAEQLARLENDEARDDIERLTWCDQRNSG